MRRFGWVVLGAMVCAPLAFATAALADDCTKDVIAAFEKQRTSKAFRVSMTQPTAEGPADMTVDYLPPNRMLQTVKSAAMAGVQQTMLVGDRAFAGSEGAFEELLPQFTQSIVAEVETALAKPQANIGNFECVGKTTFDGKEFLAYRAADKKVEAGVKPEDVLARTIYVEPASGLPAYNVVGAVSGKGDLVMKVAYSYPTDVVIEAPQGAPMQKSR
jgi:hypothetical protein